MKHNFSIPPTPSLLVGGIRLGTSEPLGREDGVSTVKHESYLWVLRIHNQLICVIGSSLVLRECPPRLSHKREGTLSGPQAWRGREDSAGNWVAWRVVWPFLTLKETTRFLYSFVDALESLWGPSWVRDAVCASQGCNTSAKDHLSYTFRAACRASIRGAPSGRSFSGEEEGAAWFMVTWTAMYLLVPQLLAKEY